MLKKGVRLSKGRPLEKGFPCRWDSVHTGCSIPLGSFAHPSSHSFNNICWVPTLSQAGTVQDTGAQQ